MTDGARAFSDRQVAFFNELLRYTAPVSGIAVAGQRACVRFFGDLSEAVAARLAELPPDQIPAAIERWFRACSEAVFAPAPAPEPGKAGSGGKPKGAKP